MGTLTSKQLETKAEEFVREYQNSSDDKISRIIAGMTAIIEGNEATYERMKNQKWFERIWYGLTLKNKATVKEMKAKREELTKYTIQILVKMNSLINEHSACIYDLYRAIAVVRRDLDVIVDEIGSLAQKLNEKIISIDNYYYLLNEIRNNKFNVNSPLISLIDIMSMIDKRTANDTKKLIQLKETMEQIGFDFSQKVDIQTYSKEILSLPEDSIGRILLFCQYFSHNSRFLAYTCSLIENYFYLWESEKRIVRENGEAIASAMDYANLNSEANCVVGEMFNDLKGAIHESFELIKSDNGNPDISAPILTPAKYFSSKTSKALNVIVTGITGSGKSTLINSIFGWNVAATGRGKSITVKTDRYNNDEDSIYFFDTPGFQINSSSHNDKIINDIKSIININMNFLLWYCINSRSSRYEDEMIEKLYSLHIPMIIVLTNSIDEDTRLETELIKYNCNNGMSDIPVLSVLAKDYYRKDFTISAFGLEELIDKSIDVAL